MAKRGPKTEEGRARALANLVEHKQPNWPPGVSGNPNGRPAGLSIIENVNQMQGLTRDEVEAVANNPRMPVAVRVAARRWLGADDGRGDDFDRIIDRTVSKPKSGDDGGGTTVTVNVTQMSRHDLVRIATRGGNGTAEA